jgi:hypothetical protein
VGDGGDELEHRHHRALGAGVGAGHLERPPGDHVGRRGAEHVQVLHAVEAEGEAAGGGAADQDQAGGRQHPAPPQPAPAGAAPPRRAAVDLDRVPYADVLLHGGATYREIAHAGQSGSYPAIGAPGPAAAPCGTMPR